MRLELPNDINRAVVGRVVDSFAAARNETLKYVKGDWIFFMDADDTLSLAAAEQVLLAAINAKRDEIGFMMAVQFVDKGPGAGTRVDHCHLFRNLPGIQWEGRIHEQIMPSLSAIGGRYSRIPGFILHSGYDTTPEGQRRKRIRDEKLLWLDYEDRPNHPFVRFNLGMSYHHWGEQEKAVEWFKRCLEVSSDGETHLRPTYSLYGRSLRELGKLEESVSVFQEGLARVGDDADIRFQFAISLTAHGRLADAKEQYLAIDPDPNRFLNSADIGILGPKRWHNLGVVCAQMGNYSEAKDWFLKAAEAGATISLETLFGEAIKREDFATARKAVETAQHVEGASERWAGLGAAFAGIRGQLPEEFLVNAVLDNPHATGPRMVLARRLVATGHFEPAAGHLKILEEIGLAEAVYLQSVSAHARGDREAALALAKRAAEMDPDSEIIRAHLQGLLDRT